MSRKDGLPCYPAEKPSEEQKMQDQQRPNAGQAQHGDNEDRNPIQGQQNAGPAIGYAISGKTYAGHPPHILS